MAEKEPKIVHKEQSQPLPPAGDERREVLRKREDNLQEQAEAMAETTDAYAMDPKALKVDRELAQHYDFDENTMLKITNRNPNRRYTWGNFSSQHGIDVRRKMGMGWKPVSGSDPECSELKAADGTRTIGDVMLMWTTPENKARIDRMHQAKRDRVYQTAVTQEQEMADFARKHPNAFIIRPSKLESQVGRASDFVGPKGQQAAPVSREIAAKMLGDMVREEIPGVPIPGKAVSR